MTTTEARELVDRTHASIEARNAEAQRTGLPRGLAMLPRLFPDIHSPEDWRYWQARHALGEITDEELEEIRRERMYNPE